MKNILILFVTFFYIFTIPVFASEEDILKEPIKEEVVLIEKEEEIKEKTEKDYYLDGDYIYYNGEFIRKAETRNTVYDPLNAKTITFNVKYTGGSVGAYVDVTSLELGQKYYLKIKDNASGNAWIPWRGLYGYPEIGYFIRGQEVRSSSFGWYDNNNEYKAQGIVDGFNDSVLNSGAVDIILYEEPTPEPTPTPDPEGPEVDPETISGNEILREILRTNREINENVQGVYKLLSNNSVSDNVLSDNSISDNIIYKRLEDYNTSESLALIGLVLAFGALVIYLIHKTVFKIRR